MLLSNWLAEKRSAYLYASMAAHEKDVIKRKLFQELANAANKQALIWENKIKQSGATVPVYRPELRARIVAGLAKYLGNKPLRFILSAMKIRGLSVYSNTSTVHSSIHANAHLEGKHASVNTAGLLRAAVFGVNDGLISNASLMMGMIGGAANHQTIVLSGMAGLLAGACSMAAGEYISVRSQREFFEYQINLEKEELKLYPEEEAAELALIYQARGLPLDEAKSLAQYMISEPNRALDTLAREELGLNPVELGSPLGAAISSFMAFSLGALVPVLPFLFGDYRWNLSISLVFTAVALFGVGATLSLFTSRSALVSGLRMLLIGGVAGCVTYFIGGLF